jgi:putative membrane protein
MGKRVARMRLNASCGSRPWLALRLMAARQPDRPGDPGAATLIPAAPVTDAGNSAKPNGEERMRKQPRWFTEGEEPDYRFSLANERTFLAWLRTGLGLLAGAVALIQLAPSLTVTGLESVLAGLLAVSGTVLAAFAYRRWAEVQRAMRRKQPLPMTWLPFLIGWMVAGAGAIVVLLVVRHVR